MDERGYGELLKDFFEASSTEIGELVRAMGEDTYIRAVEMILDCERNHNRVHVTGIGKPGHVAGYIASLLSSTGTPAYVLDATEAVHGSSGQVCPGDVVIAISNSGETEELKATICTVKNNGAKIIAVTGNTDSWLARNADECLSAGVRHEGGPLNRAPRISVTAEILALQGLSILLQNIKDITPQQYVRWHPGGALGKPREGEV